LVVASPAGRPKTGQNFSKKFFTHANFGPCECENRLDVNQPMPRELYHYMDKSDARIHLKVNQARIHASLNPGSVRIERRRQEAADVTELDLRTTALPRRPLPQGSGTGAVHRRGLA